MTAWIAVGVVLAVVATLGWVVARRLLDIPLEVQQAAMGIDWMTLEELSEAIPPAYTEFIGAQLYALVTEGVAA